MNRKQRRTERKLGGGGVVASSPAQALFADAVGHHQAGRLAEAERLYRSALTINPRHDDSLHLLGVIASQSGRHDVAVELIRKAIAINGRAAGYHFNLALALRHLNRLDEAAAIWRKCLTLEPGDTGVLCHLADCLRDLGKLDEAVACWRRAIALNPSLPDALTNLGAALRELGDCDGAVLHHRRALELRPDLAEAHNNLGNAFLDLGRLGEAAAAFGRALALRPDFAEASANLGIILQRQGRLDEAVTCHRRALAANPEIAQAHSNLGSALLDLGQLAEATACLRRAIDLQPDLAEAHDNLGSALQESGLADESEACHRRAISLCPDFAEAHNNLGFALHRQGRLAEAQACFARAAALAPDDGAFYRSQMFNAAYRDDLGDSAMAALHVAVGDAYARPPVLAATPSPEPERRLRIGYLSSDLRQHPVAGNLLPVLRHTDRERVSQHFYAHVIKADGMTERFKAMADGWCDIAGFKDREVAERIRDDGIDILVCLAGRFDRNRATVCGWRAAPIQISLHDVATSGLAAMDYLIADCHLVPRGGAEAFRERVLRLPHFPIFDPPDDFPEPVTTRAPGPPVFGCFNNPTKITATVLALWGRILAARPEARLVLKYRNAYDDETARRRLTLALTQAGARAEQIVLLTGIEPLADLLGRYGGIDVALDTMPFCGSTTSFQALAMGVPVVTWPQGRMVSGWTASMLHAVGLPDLIAGSADGYVDLAVALADAADAWRSRRGDIRRKLVASALCDGRRWAGHLERLYRAVWRRHCAAQARARDPNQ